VSAGERSCAKFSTCRIKCLPEECSVSCLEYKYDGKTKPDTRGKRRGTAHRPRKIAAMMGGDYCAPARRKAKRARYVECVGRSEVNRRREKRRREAAALKAQAKHCLTCGCTHAGWCPPEAFNVVTCHACGNAFIQPMDVGSMMGIANCGNCGKSDAWNQRPADLNDMRKHWKGYGEGVGTPCTMKG
jgi:transcription elongation factor Elf1